MSFEEFVKSLGLVDCKEVDYEPYIDMFSDDADYFKELAKQIEFDKPGEVV